MYRDFTLICNSKWVLRYLGHQKRQIFCQRSLWMPYNFFNESLNIWRPILCWFNYFVKIKYKIVHTWNVFGNGTSVVTGKIFSSLIWASIQSISKVMYWKIYKNKAEKASSFIGYEMKNIMIILWLTAQGLPEDCLRTA